MYIRTYYIFLSPWLSSSALRAHWTEQQAAGVQQLCWIHTSHSLRGHFSLLSQATENSAYDRVIKRSKSNWRILSNQSIDFRKTFKKTEGSSTDQWPHNLVCSFLLFFVFFPLMLDVLFTVVVCLYAHSRVYVYVYITLKKKKNV